MSLKVVVCICLAIVVLASVQGAPNTSRKDQDLRKSFIEFVQQDKELSALLGKGNLQDITGLSRSIRQADENEFKEENEQQEGPEGPERPKDGFFDRAAKFVMEVLQRFLKWVNADN